MAREFEGTNYSEPTEKKVELRDIIALLMPPPPYTFTDPQNRGEQFMAEMRARYCWADRVIKEVR